MAFLDLWPGSDAIHETVSCCLVFFVQGNFDKNGQCQAQGLVGKKCDITTDEAGLLQQSHTSMTARGGQVDLFRELSV